MIQHLIPRIEFDMVRIDVDDKVVVEMVASDIALRVRKNLSRVGACRDLLRGSRFCCHRRISRCAHCAAPRKKPQSHIEWRQILRAK